MDNNIIRGTLEFVDNVVAERVGQHIPEVGFVIELTEAVVLCVEKNRHLLPYHLNLIDELHINENGHSRILYKLLQYEQQDGTHPILQSLLDYISTCNGEFKAVRIEDPTITQEKCRIDLWVRDKKSGYAVIIENKVYNAQDQNAQLSRYIDCTRAEGFEEECIFVIYLSQQGEEPAEQSWGNYKSQFEKRYINLSFRYDILSWLKECAWSKLHEKDTLLRCAFVQYVDYLEGFFKLRKTVIDMKVEDSIKEKLNLDENSESNYSALMQKIKDVDETRKYLINMRDKWEKECWILWYDALKERYGDKLNILHKWSDKYPHVGVVLSVCEKEIDVIIERDYNLYYGVSTHQQEERDEDIYNILKPAFKRLYGNPANKWYAWEYVAPDNAYEQLCMLIDDVLTLRENSETHF